LGKRLRNGLFCVEWDVKPQLNQSVNSLSLSVRAPTWFFCSSINATAARAQKNTTNPKIAWSLIASLPRVGGLQLSVVAKQDDRSSSTDTRQQWLAVPAVDGSYFLHRRSRVSSLLPQHKRAERTYVADAVYLANR